MDLLTEHLTCTFHAAETGENLNASIFTHLKLFSLGTKMFAFGSICLEVGRYFDVQRTVNKLQINHISSAL